MEWKNKQIDKFSRLALQINQKRQNLFALISMYVGCMCNRRVVGNKRKNLGHDKRKMAFSLYNQEELSQ